MNQFTFLAVVIFAIIPQGYGLKCHMCNTASDPNACQTPTEITCQAPNDRCFTRRIMMDMGVTKMTGEERNCAIAAMACTEAYKQQLCQQMNQSSSGTLKSCNYSCCEGDLCNDGTNPPGSGLTPPKPASNLSCYECSPEGMGPNGTGTPLISCSAPKQRKCGDYFPGTPFDRCMIVKTTAKNPKTGALLEQEMRNCSLSSMMCTGGPSSPCVTMNSTGDIAKCNVQCCEGNLCNGVSQSTTGPPPSGPKGGQTPLAVSGILAIISIVLASLFK